MITNLIAAVFAVGYLGTTVWLCRGFRFTVRALCLGAIAIAATCVLSLIYIPLPTGASITAGSWLPLILLALTYDKRLAMLAGMVCGALAPFLLPGWSLVHWAQFFLEYLTIFSCLGYAAVFGTRTKQQIAAGIVLAVVLRIAAQTISGAVFFGQYAWDGWGAWGYSIVFHLSGKIPEGIITLLLALKMPLRRLSALAQKGTVQ